MTREEAKKLLPIIKAYAEGKTIQVIDTTDPCGTWADVVELKIYTDFEEYRIKPDAKKKVNIIEKGLEEREETLMVKGIYDKLEDYRKEHPESSFMVISYNNKDKVGTSFLLGSEEDIAKEGISLITYKKNEEIANTFSRVCLEFIKRMSRR